LQHAAPNAQANDSTVVLSAPPVTSLTAAIIGVAKLNKAPWRISSRAVLIPPSPASISHNFNCLQLLLQGFLILVRHVPLRRLANAKQKSSSPAKKESDGTLRRPYDSSSGSVHLCRIPSD
jgi:hypothetical protein